MKREQNRIRDLENRIAQLEARIALLESRPVVYNPVYGPSPVQTPYLPNLLPTIICNTHT